MPPPNCFACSHLSKAALPGTYREGVTLYDWGSAVLEQRLRGVCCGLGRKQYEGKKEGAIHAPVRCVLGLGLMAFLGHPKHARRPDLDQ